VGVPYFWSFLWFRLTTSISFSRETWNAYKFSGLFLDKFCLLTAYPLKFPQNYKWNLHAACLVANFVLKLFTQFLRNYLHGVYTILLSPHQLLVCMRMLLSLNWENIFSVQLVCICRPMFAYDCLFWPNDLLYSPTKHMSAVTFTWGMKNVFIVFYIYLSELYTFQPL
jgi:hypothetical protein